MNLDRQLEYGGHRLHDGAEPVDHRSVSLLLIQQVARFA